MELLESVIKVMNCSPPMSNMASSPVWRTCRTGGTFCLASTNKAFRSISTDSSAMRRGQDKASHTAFWTHYHIGYSKVLYKTKCVYFFIFFKNTLIRYFHCFFVFSFHFTKFLSNFKSKKIYHSTLFNKPCS